MQLRSRDRCQEGSRSNRYCLLQKRACRSRPQPGTAHRHIRSAITSPLERFSGRQKKAKPKRTISKPTRPTGKFILADVFAVVVTLTLAVAFEAEPEIDGELVQGIRRADRAGGLRNSK
jgi:hypothetical protein